MPAWPRALCAITLVLSLLATGVAPLSAHSASGSTAADLSAADANRVTSVSEPSPVVETVYRVDVQADGDARWTVNRTVQFDTAGDRAGFEELAEQFNNGEHQSQTLSAFEGASDLAGGTTGRPMEITDVTRSTHVGSDSGSLVVSFRWTNFAQQEDGRIYVADVFQTEPLWFHNLTDRQRLIIARPDGYQFYNVSTNVQNRILRWDGPHTFETGRPYAVFDPISQPSTPPARTTTTPLPASSDTPTGIAVGAILLLLVLAGAGYAIHTGHIPHRPTAGDSGSDTPAATGSDSGAASGAESERQPPDTPVADNSRDGATGETTGGTAAQDSPDSGDESATADPTDEPVDEELLSDEERVKRLLERNDGRMKQARIVEETGWSNAKVSQLLSSMADDDQIEKLRIGRENLISFPGEGPE